MHMAFSLFEVIYVTHSWHGCHLPIAWMPCLEHVQVEYETPRNILSNPIRMPSPKFSNHSQYFNEIEENRMRHIRNKL